MVAQLQLTIRH